MKSRTACLIIGILVIVGMALAACTGTAMPAPTAQPAAAATSAPAPTQAPAASSQPTDLKIGIIMQSNLQGAWNIALMQSIKRIQDAKPNGLNITYDLTESVSQADAERVIRQYASSGKYGIIWCNSTFPDAVAAVRSEYPDTVFVVTGAGNKAMDTNGYWFDLYAKDPAYLMGIIAGKMTKSNTLGVVATFPYPNVNIGVNAFVAGAQSANPNVKVMTTMIGSWFDPPKAKESAQALIASGADLIFGQTFGTFDAAEAAGIYAFGFQVDQWDTKPSVVLTSGVEQFDPALDTVINAWWSHITTGAPYEAPNNVIVYTMKDGGSALAPYHGNETLIPQDVLDLVEQTTAKIMAGDLVVPIDPAPPQS